MPKYDVQLMGEKSVTVYYTFEVDANTPEEAEDKAFFEAERLRPSMADEAGDGEINWSEVMSNDEL